MPRDFLHSKVFQTKRGIFQKLEKKTLLSLHSDKDIMTLLAD
jgi:hypothetical protein